MTKCKHCINDANRFLSGFCSRCYDRQDESKGVTVQLSKDDADFIAGLIYSYSRKLKEPFKQNAMELIKKF